jgi:hypothetical protein
VSAKEAQISNRIFRFSKNDAIHPLILIFRPWLRLLPHCCKLSDWEPTSLHQPFDTMLRTCSSAIGKLSRGRSATTAWRPSASSSSPAVAVATLLNSNSGSCAFYSSSSLAAASPSYFSTRTLLPIKTTFDLPDPAAVFDGHRDDTSHTSFPLAKIVATIGPTSEQKEPLYNVTAAGMRIMRLNFSHATVEEVELRVTNLAAAQVCMYLCHASVCVCVYTWWFDLSRQLLLL